MHRVSALALASIGLFAAACADTATVTQPARTAPDASLDVSSTGAANRHVMPTRELANQANPSNAAAKRGTNTGISYHGGPVLQAATNVVAVYWASSPIYTGGPAAGTTGAGSQDGSLVGYFLGHVGGSSYFNINTTYTDGSGAHIANVVNYNGFWANNTSVPANGASVSDAQMVSMLQSGFDSGALTYDPSTLYAIFSAGTVNLGGGFGTQYCAYHTHGTVTVNGVARTVLYAAMPYNYAYPSACTSGYAAPNGDPGADYEVNTLVHEVEETTTDMMGTAWYDTRGYENADKCAWTWGTTANNGTGVYNTTIGGRNFLVQQNWINAGSGGCRMSY